MVFLGSKWQDPSLSLGERCVAFSVQEMNDNVKEDKLNSFTSPRIREYLSICTRLINGKETKLNLTSCNWCAAGVSFALHESLLSNEIPPHGYRVGVVEIVADMQHNNTYYTSDQVKQGIYTPQIGDVVIFDRSTPGKPETSWWRHIGRVYSIDSPDIIKCISGNNGGTWKIDSHQISKSKILGFGCYPKLKEVILPVGPRPNQPFDNEDISNLAPSEDSGSLISLSIFDKFKNIFKS